MGWWERALTCAQPMEGALASWGNSIARTWQRACVYVGLEFDSTLGYPGEGPVDEAESARARNAARRGRAPPKPPHARAEAGKLRMLTWNVNGLHTKRRARNAETPQTTHDNNGAAKMAAHTS